MKITINQIYDMSVVPSLCDDDSYIICNSISGGADYHFGMPRRLNLSVVDKNGMEQRAEYILAVSSITDKGLVEPYNPPPTGEKK